MNNNELRIKHKGTGKKRSFFPVPFLPITNCQLPTNFNSGFTIVETLVSLAIFSVSVIGLITVTTQGSIDAKFYKKKIIASHLAQENLERIRNIRDSGTLSGSSSTPWNDFKNTISGCVPTNNFVGCYPASSTDIKKCDAVVKEGCPLFDLYGTYTSYVFTSGVPVAFWSVVQIVDMGDSVKVISTVSWGEGVSVTMSENLFDWQ